MRAGQLDREITIQRSTTTINAYGVPSESWAGIATLRAQVVQASTEEFIQGSAGASDQTATVFRTWWLEGVTNADRILYDGMLHDIKEVKEIGRRNGLEIRTTSAGEDA